MDKKLTWRSGIQLLHNRSDIAATVLIACTKIEHQATSSNENNFSHITLSGRASEDGIDQYGKYSYVVLKSTKLWIALLLITQLAAFKI